MVFFNYFNLSGFKNWAAGRVRALSQSFAQVFGRLGRHRTRLIGAAYFAVSVALGFVAFTCSREEAIEYWERTFLPSGQVIGFALGSRGLVAAVEGYQLQKVLRSLPTSLDDRGSIWLSADPIWVAVFLPSKDDSSVQAETYCLDCKNLPKNWQPMGIGWRAMDKVVNQIDNLLKRRKETKIAPSTQIRSRRDPREFIY